MVRGSDWDWGDLDGGHGCVGVVLEETTDAGWVKVKWIASGFCNNYRIGADGKYDLAAAAEVRHRNALIGARGTRVG